MDPPFNFTTVLATDEDIFGNAQLIYTLEGGSLTWEAFEIEPISGRVFLRSGPAGRLDRERQDFYEVSL